MKKILGILLVCSMTISLVACTPGTKSAASAPSGAKQSQSSTAPVESTSEIALEATPEPVKEAAFYFKDNVAQLEDLRIEITEYKVIQPGEEGNSYGENPVIAFWYNTTNLTDKKLNPMTAWIAVFEAIQDNNPNAVNTLSVASLPDSDFLESQMQTIKKNGTVANAMAYTLTDATTPVTLKAKKGFAGKILGEQSFNLE